MRGTGVGVGVGVPTGVTVGPTVCVSGLVTTRVDVKPVTAMGVVEPLITKVLVSSVVGVAVGGNGVGVSVWVGGTVGVAVLVSVAVGVGVLVFVGVADGDGVAVAVLVAVGGMVAVLVAVAVALIAAVSPAWIRTNKTTATPVIVIPRTNPIIIFFNCGSKPGNNNDSPSLRYPHDVFLDPTKAVGHIVLDYPV